MRSIVQVIAFLPRWALRMLLWTATHTVYRIRVEGRGNIPAKGGALLVCNHLSFVDALLLGTSTRRWVRFLIFKDIYEHPLIFPWASMLRAIPISSELRPRDMIRSLREASESIQRGELVCIFAEGQITRIGQLLPFRRGLERIMKGVDAPIIPAHLDGVWGSIFSFERGRFLWKWPREVPYPVTVSFGKPLPSDSSPAAIRAAVLHLQTEAFQHRKERMRTLARGFIRTARAHPRRFAMADGRTPHVRFGDALTRTVFLARRLRRVWQGQEMVGVMLPPSVGGALVNHAAMLMGKVPVNLNYTASNSVLESCARQCDLRTTITSKEFLEKVKVQPPGEVVCLEDLAQKPGVGEKLVAWMLARLAPASLLLERLGGVKAKLDDPATVIFSSGSTGEPKGVVLSHYNIGANVEQVGQVFALDAEDRIVGILPFFHSFGFTVTVCLPAVLGVGVIYHPNPLDAHAIGVLAEQHAATFLLATPTFLQHFVRRCTPEQFGSLNYVLAGAEKMPERVAQAFEERFGIRPLEGYGCTECSPVVSVNSRDYRAAGFRQVGAKRGSIGHPLPGMSVRIVHPESGEPLAANQAGLLLVRGPNVMRGYLGQPERTASVLKDGWYNTGDIACADEDGFLSISDRLSRFSKIGGEMVPHIKLEQTLEELAELPEPAFAVTGVPDEKKGERLIVLHTLDDAKLEAVLEKLEREDLPALWKPRASQFFYIEALPYLGTGKLDLCTLKQLAQKLAQPAQV